MALPISGTCDVATAPTTFAMALLRPFASQHRPELLFGHARLLRADLLHVEAEDPGELRQIVDVPPRLDQGDDVAVLDRLSLFGRQAVFRAVRLLVLEERGAVLRGVERVAHLVERVPLHRSPSVEQDRVWNVAAERGFTHTVSCMRPVSASPDRSEGPPLQTPARSRTGGMRACRGRRTDRRRPPARRKIG